MKLSFSLFFLILFFFCLQSLVSAGNLSLIEKRLTELNKLNKNIVRQVGEIPQDGSIEIEAQILPGKTGSHSLGNVTEGSFEFGKVKIQSIDKKHPFTVQISSSQSLAQCYRVATMLRRAGYPAFTASQTLGDKGIWHRIFIGSYPTREDAKKIEMSLENDEISDGFVRSMPYAIQIGKAGSLDSIKPLRENISSMQYLPYISYVRDTKTNARQTRLLVGAFETKQDTSNLLATFRSEGLQARVVNR